MTTRNFVGKLLCSTALFSSLVFYTNHVFAQDGLVTLDEVSIYAQRGEKEAFDVPGMVTVVGKDEIDALQANSQDDVFKGVPGVVFDGGPRRAGLQPSIRGLDSDSILILFDDARQSFQSGHDGRFLIDPSVLKQVEIVRGPSSALYGSGTIGGVFAFQTIDAADLIDSGETRGVRFKFGYQDVDQEFTSAVTAYQVTPDGIFDILAHFSYRNGDDIELGNGLLLPADDRLKNGLFKAKVKLSEETTLTTSWLYTELKGRDPQNPQGNNVGSTSNPLVDRENVSSTLQTKLEFNPINNDLIDMKIVGYGTLNEVKEPETDSSRITTREVETLGFSAQNRSLINFTKSMNALFTYGLEYYRDDQEGRDNTSATGTRGGVPNARADFFGSFIQGEFTFKDMVLPGKLTVTPGIRYDKFETSSQEGEDTDETAISPKIAASYEPLPWLQIFGNYGEAFRAPSFNEIYAFGTHFSIPNLSAGFPPVFVNNEFIANPDLKPEEAEGWEIGLGLKFDNVITQSDRFRIKGAYWESDVTNLIALDVNTPLGCFVNSPFVPPCGSGAAFNNISQNVNVNNAELKGFEVEMNYDSSLFYAKATYSHMDGIDADTGDYVGVLTPDIFYIDAGVKIEPYSLRLGARATFAAEFDKVNNTFERRDSYSLYDLYAIWEPSEGALKGLRVDLGIDNLTDEDYEIVNAGVSEAGRNYKAAISYKIPICGNSFGCNN